MASSSNRRPGHKVHNVTGLKGKQIRRSLNLETKLKIIQLLEEGKSATKLGRFLGVAESSIRTIGKYKDKIKKCSLASQELGLGETKCRIKDVDLVSTESLLLLWIEDQTERQVTLTPGVVRKKAVEIYHYLTKYKTNDRGKFVASMSWCDNFKKRHKLSNKMTSHPAFDLYHRVANARIANLFIVDFKDFIESEQYRLDQIFCVKETKLFWKKIPGTHLFKPAVDRMVSILTSNMAGNIRCKPAVIFSMGDSSFDSLHHNDCECCDLPVNWYAKATTWMNSPMFQEWLLKLFVPEVKGHCERLGIPFKILLLLDKAPSHQDLPEIPNVNVMYLPSNNDSITNPMNHGIISEFQIGYLKNMLEALLEVVDSRFHKSRSEVWNNFNKGDAIDLIGQTWNEISETTMREAWAYISGKEEDIQARESRMADRIDSCLHLLEKLVCRSVNLGRNEILKFLKSHNQEVSNEELADLRNMVQSVLKDSTRSAFKQEYVSYHSGRKMNASNKPTSIEPEQSGSNDERNLHSIDDINPENNDDESNESIDPTGTYEGDSSSSEMTDVDMEDPQNEVEEAINGKIKLDCLDNLKMEPAELELIEIEDSDEESETEIKEEEECETQYKNQIYNQVSDEHLGQNCKHEPPSDLVEISDDDSQAESRTVVTNLIRLSSFNEVKLEPEDREQVKIEVSEPQLILSSNKDGEKVVKEEGEEAVDNKIEVDLENISSPETHENKAERLTIAQLQRLIGLTYRLIAKSRENDDNPDRRERFISDVENAMRPYKRSLDLKLGGDELW